MNGPDPEKTMGVEMQQVSTDGDPLRFPEDAMDHGQAYCCGAACVC